MQSQSIFINKPFQLTSGQKLPNLTIRFSFDGKYNPLNNNSVWIIPPMISDSNVTKWWGGLVGDQKLYNPEEHFIVSVDHLGSIFGTSGPLSIGPNDQTYYYDFPEISILDIVNINDMVREYLRVDKIETLIGVGFAGQVALNWEVENPGIAEHLILIASNGKQSEWAKMLNEHQIKAIENDPTWSALHPSAARKGLAVALAMSNLKKSNPKALSSILLTEEEETFNAISYTKLLSATDRFDVGAKFGGLIKALNRIVASTLIVRVEDDPFVSEDEQMILTQSIEQVDYEYFSSDLGIDGLYTEANKLSLIIEGFYHNIEFKKMLNHLFQNAS